MYNTYSHSLPDGIRVYIQPSPEENKADVPFILFILPSVGCENDKPNKSLTPQQ